jgi:hypothetical protein
MQQARVQSTLAGLMRAGLMRMVVWVWVWVCVCAWVAPASAASRGSTAANPAASWLRGNTLQPAVDTPLLPSRRLDRGGASTLGTGQTTTTSNRGRYAVPVVLSLLVPGTGEISTGHWWNGLPLLAADVATWIGYAHYESNGQDTRDAFEAFADQHWSESTWNTNMGRYYDPQSPDFITGSPQLWVGEPPPGYCDCSPPYIPYEEDPQEYYENAGKYRHFYPGWDDWVAPATGPDIPDSPNRRTYVDMRIESNDNFDNADAMLGVAALTRVVSALQSIWLVRRDSHNDGLSLEPVTFGRGMGSGLRLRHRF